MSKKVLIVYATRFGATKSTAEEVAKTLKETNFEVKVVNAKEEKIKDLTEYDLVVVGSGLSNCSWGSEVEDFVKKHRNELASKKTALFVSSLKPVEEKAGKTEAVDRIQKIGLDDKIKKYQLKPIATAVFGGVVDYNQMNFLIRKSMELGYRSQLQNGGFVEVASGVYDLRDWTAIRSWALELARTAQS
jgi:menaquinone-dependent protoporphyrinogen IX oxidase